MMIRELATRRAVIVAMLAAAGACCGQTQQAATWTGNGGLWWDGTNWDCSTGGGCIPDNDVTNTWWVLINAGQLCNLNQSARIDRLGMDSGTTLNQFNNTQFRFVGDETGNGTHGTFTVAGTFQMSSTGHNTDLIVEGGADATLWIGGVSNGEGLIEISDATTNRIYGASGTETIHFTDWLEIHGSGNIGVNSARIVNQGCVFRATQTQPMIFDPSDALGFLNESFIIAEQVGTAQLNTGVFENTNGWIGANSPGATLLLNGGTIVGGHVQSGSGLIQFNGGAVVGTPCLLGHISTGEGGGLVTANTFVEDITNYGTLTLRNNVAGLHVRDEIRNYGLVSFESTGHNTDLILEADTTLIQGGEVRLSNLAANRVYAQGGTHELRNWDNWIHGSGQIGINQLRLNNSGVIEADGSAGLVLDLAGDSSINTGVLAASGGGTLTIQTDTIDQVSTGQVIADDGGVVQLNGVTMIGGTFATAGTGVLRSASGRLIGPTMLGLFEQLNNTTSFLWGSVENQGLMDMQSTGHNTNLVLEDPVTLSGGGTISMSANAQNRIYSNAASLFSNVDNTIHGGGQIGVNQTALGNSGVIVADAAGVTLTLDPNATGMSNTGMMRASGGGILVLANGPYDSTGGFITADAGSRVRLGSGAEVTGGTIAAEAGGVLEFNGGATLTTVPTIEPGGFGEVTAGNGGVDAGLVNHGEFTWFNNTNLRAGQTVQNTGLLRMSSTGHNTDLILAGDVTLHGGGECALSTSSANRVYGAVVTYRLTNADNWIHGAGQLGINRMSLTNSGVIEADAGVPLVMDLQGSSFNVGTLRASSGAMLDITSSESIDQTGGGVVEALDGSVVRVTNTTISGGTVRTAGSGVVRNGGNARLMGVVNDGLFELPNNTTASLADTITNAGTMVLGSTGHNTNLVLTTPVVLTGGGEVVSTNAAANRIYGQSSGLVLTNADNTLHLAGQLGVNLLGILNQGSIVADGASVGLDIDPHDAAGLINEGSLLARSPGGIDLRAGLFENRGGVVVEAGSRLTRHATEYLQTAGSTTVDGPLTLNSGGVVTLAGGSLGGSGTVNAGVVNTGGGVVPGGAPGELTVTDDYTQGAGGALEVEVGTGGASDRLVVGSVAAVDGVLRVTRLGGYSPTVGDSFEVLSAGAVTGVFGSIEVVGFPWGLTIEQVVEPTRVLAVVAIGGCVGDWNGDGTINTLDFIAYLNDWSTQQGTDCTGGCTADLNGDGTVNTIDFIAFLNAWSAGC